MNRSQAAVQRVSQSRTQGEPGGLSPEEQCPNLVLKSNPKLSVERKKSKSLLMTMMKTTKLPKGRLVAERLKT